MITRTLAAGLLMLSLAACGDDDDEITTKLDPGQVTTAPQATAQNTPPPVADGKPSAALKSVLADVNKLAPALESYFRGDRYPTAVDEVVAALAKAKLTLSKGNSIGGYRYDASDVEFVLCVENTSGAYATYDTAPMTTGQSGESGGCPA